MIDYTVVELAWHGIIEFRGKIACMVSNESFSFPLNFLIIDFMNYLLEDRPLGGVVAVGHQYRRVRGKDAGW